MKKNLFTLLTLALLIVGGFTFAAFEDVSANYPNINKESKETEENRNEEIKNTKEVNLEQEEKDLKEFTLILPKNKKKVTVCFKNTIVSQEEIKHYTELINSLSKNKNIKNVIITSDNDKAKKGEKIIKPSLLKNEKELEKELNK